MIKDDQAENPCCTIGEAMTDADTSMRYSLAAEAEVYQSNLYLEACDRTWDQCQHRFLLWLRQDNGSASGFYSES